MLFHDLGKAINYIKSNPDCEVYGSVIVRRREYNDNAIKALVGVSIDGWKFGGDQSEDESNIYID
jgi:hypothetical protein